LVLAAHNYESAKKKLPPHGNVRYVGSTAAGALGSQALLLGYMEEQNLQGLVDINAHWPDNSNKTARTTPLPLLRCPDPSSIPQLNVMDLNPEVDEENMLRCHYAGNMGARPGPNEDGQTGTGCSPSSGGKGGGGSTAFVWPELSYTQHACGDRAGGYGEG